MAEKKDADGHDQFVVLFAGASEEAVQKSIGAFHKDLEWQRTEKETEAGGQLRSGVAASKLTPADLSPLK